MIDWTEIEPKDAVNIILTEKPDCAMTYRPDIRAPLTELGERCPWPWEPQQLVGVPMGQSRCPYCGAMVLAGYRISITTQYTEMLSDDLFSLRSGTAPILKISNSEMQIQGLPRRWWLTYYLELGDSYDQKTRPGSVTSVPAPCGSASEVRTQCRPNRSDR